MKFKTKFQKSKASKDAFYVVLPFGSSIQGCEIVMCYQKEIADALAVGCGRVVNYSTMLSLCGNGRPVTFFNFYLS